MMGLNEADSRARFVVCNFTAAGYETERLHVNHDSRGR